MERPPCSCALYRKHIAIVAVSIITTKASFQLCCWAWLMLITNSYGLRTGFGHMSDSQILNESDLKECILDGYIGFPAADNDVGKICY